MYSRIQGHIQIFTLLFFFFKVIFKYCDSCGLEWARMVSFRLWPTFSCTCVNGVMFMKTRITGPMFYTYS